jgi:hypothetical protein
MSDFRLPAKVDPEQRVVFQYFEGAAHDGPLVKVSTLTDVKN